MALIIMTEQTSTPSTPATGDWLLYPKSGGWYSMDDTGAELPIAGSALSDGDKGDITVSLAGSTWIIDNGAVTLAKMADMATASLIYRKTAGAGAPEVNTLATLKTDLTLAKADVGLNLVDNVQQIPMTYLDTDTALATNSDARVPSQKAVKTYVDTAVTGLLDFRGSTNCSTNPNYPVGYKGDAYIVSVAGKIGGTAGKSVDVGDVYLCLADNAGGAEAAVGASWSVLEHNLIGALLTANNLSDLTSASTARSNLGLTIGTNVQAWDADLDTWAGKTAPSGAVLGATDTQTVTNKRNTPRMYQTISLSTLTPEIASYDYYELTAQAAALNIANMSTSTPTGGEKIIIAITSDATPHALTYGTDYVAIGVALPTTTVASKTTILGFIRNAGLSKWALVAVGQEA